MHIGGIGKVGKHNGVSWHVLDNHNLVFGDFLIVSHVIGIEHLNDIVKLMHAMSIDNGLAFQYTTRSQIPRRGSIGMNTVPFLPDNVVIGRIGVLATRIGHTDFIREVFVITTGNDRFGIGISVGILLLFLKCVKDIKSKTVHIGGRDVVFRVRRRGPALDMSVPSVLPILSVVDKNLFTGSDVTQGDIFNHETDTELIAQFLHGHVEPFLFVQRGGFVGRPTNGGVGSR
mmetsp:Transcript_2835/g.4852  ORF Transcript_2835/g.4852 Transcript_2835/m.4852 type:complete len:230 (-) Transcript_2835:410-1099(-)